MSIVSALKAQEGSIRELAMLPQQQLLKMAQMGQLSVSMVPIILSEKAQMAQQAANMQAMGQQMPPTVIEQVLAANAQAEAQQQAPMGIEALPSGQQMYNEQSLAGGGIVAFDDGGEVIRAYNGIPPERFEAASESVRRARRSQLGLDQAGLDDQTRRDRDAMMDTLRKLKAAGMDLATLPGRGLFGAFESGITRPLRAMGVPLPYLPSSVYGGDASSMTPYFDALRREEQARVGAQPEAAKPDAVIPPTATAQAKTEPVGIAAAPGAQTVAEPKSTVPTIEDIMKERQRLGPQGMAFEELEREIRGSADQKKADRQQNMWMRVAEAGFGIMSGQSPYALANIGKGMSAAMQSYAEDLKEQKKLDREDRKTLADIQQARRAEAKGDYDKAADLREKVAKRLSDEDLVKLQRKTQLEVARIGAESRQRPGISYGQMAKFRQDAIKNVDENQVRATVAEQLKIKPPKPGVDKSFDARVNAAYEDAINKYISRILGGVQSSAATFPGFSLVSGE